MNTEIVTLPFEEQPAHEVAALDGPRTLLAVLLDIRQEAASAIGCDLAAVEVTAKLRNGQLRWDVICWHGDALIAGWSRLTPEEALSDLLKAKASKSEAVA